MSPGKPLTRASSPSNPNAKFLMDVYSTNELSKLSKRAILGVPYTAYEFNCQHWRFFVGANLLQNRSFSNMQVFSTQSYRSIAFCIILLTSVGIDFEC